MRLATAAMRVDRIDTIPGLVGLEEEWQGLLTESTCNHVFVTHPWSLTWWETFGTGRQLQLLAMRQAGELVGLAPLYLDRIEGGGVIKFVGGTDLSDHLDILSRRGWEEPVQRAVLDYLEQLPDWQRMSLWNLPEDCRARPGLVELAAEMGWQARLQRQDVAPYIPLPESWEAYLEGLDAKQRHETRRKLRRIERQAETEWLTVSEPEELVGAMDGFIGLFRASSQEKRIFMDGRMEGYFRTLVERTGRRGWARLHFVRLDGRLAAGILTFDYADNVYVYNSGYDPQAYAHLSPGIALFAQAIRDAIERGRQRFDLLRGDEAYKYRMGAIDRAIYRLEIERSKG